MYWNFDKDVNKLRILYTSNDSEEFDNVLVNMSLVLSLWILFMKSKSLGYFNS